MRFPPAIAMSYRSVEAHPLKLNRAVLGPKLAWTSQRGEDPMAQLPNVIDEFEAERVDPASIQREIDDIIAKLKQKGVDQVKGIKPGDFRVEKIGHGVGVIETVVLSFSGALAKEVAVVAWKKVIWPSMEQRLGKKVKRKRA
jgi:hypothetical protein